jgi:hypothetical protein
MSDMKQMVKTYGEYSAKLAKHLKAEAKLNMEDQLAIENHILIVQLAMTIAKYGPKRSTPVEP